MNAIGELVENNYHRIGWITKFVTCSQGFERIVRSIEIERIGSFAGFVAFSSLCEVTGACPAFASLREASAWQAGTRSSCMELRHGGPVHARDA